MIEGAVRGVENQMAVMTLAQVLLNLAHYGRRQLALKVPTD
jgi:hypothetical protein